MSNDNTLPAIIDNTFGLPEKLDRITQGERLKFVDGRWTTQDGEPIPAGKRFLVMKTAKANRRWANHLIAEEVFETPGHPLPDIDELNAKIPQKQWDVDKLGNPSPSWQCLSIAYLVGVTDGSTYTYAHNTGGAHAGIRMLKERIANMRALTGKPLVPVVELGSRMHSKKNNKLGPDFKAVDWIVLGGNGAQSTQQIDVKGSSSAQQIEHDELRERAKRKLAKPIDSDDDLNDEIPF